MAAVLIYFRHDLVAHRAHLVARACATRSCAATLDARMGWYLISRRSRSAILGLLFQDQIENGAAQPLPHRHHADRARPRAVLADRRGHARPRDSSDLGRATALIIGLAQSLALVPGVSRSGATITAGLFLGFDREAAARFSFLLRSRPSC